MNAPTLYVIRGLPSAGKTDLADRLAPLMQISLDQIRAAIGVEQFTDARHLFLAKQRERNIVKEWMQRGAPAIAVHDVNATRDDVREWIHVAVEHGYRWAVIHVETDLNDADLAARSRTNCPPDAIQRFRERWQSWGA